MRLQQIHIARKKKIKEQLYKTKEQTNKQKINKQTKKTYSQWVSLSLLWQQVKGTAVIYADEGQTIQETQHLM